MLTMNRATVLGHAGRNPEIRTLPSGDEVALFSLATNERFRRRDGSEGESTEWHAIVAFGNAAQMVRKLVRRGRCGSGRGAHRDAHLDRQGRDGAPDLGDPGLGSAGAGERADEARPGAGRRARTAWRSGSAGHGEAGGARAG